MEKNYITYWITRFIRITMQQVTLTMILCGAVPAYANYGQGLLDKEITCRFQDVPLKKILSEIEKQASVKFAYSGSDVKLSDKATLNVTGKKLSEVLDELLTPRSIKYEANDTNNFIILRTSKSDKTSSLDSVSLLEGDEQQPGIAVTITGKVTSVNDNQPMAGVNVVIKGSTKGTSTDAEGKYSIDAEDDDVLVFSFIGYKTFEAQVGGRTVIDVILEEDIATLGEVVVNAGYWQTKEREKTGNISKVKGEEIQKQPVSNPLQALQGRIWRRTCASATRSSATSCSGSISAC